MIGWGISVDSTYPFQPYVTGSNVIDTGTEISHISSAVHVEVDCVSRRAFAITTAGQVMSWNAKHDGDFDRNAYVPDDMKSDIIAIASQMQILYAVKSNGKIITWPSTKGISFYTQDDNLFVPRAIRDDVTDANNTRVIAIESGDQHIIALTSDNNVIAWGKNNFGQIDVPASLLSGNNCIAIDSGYNHSLALTTDGEVIAWGDNSIGQTSVPASARSGIIAIACGYFHSLALTANGEVIAWGLNDNGQSSVPDLVKSGIVAISGGWFHSMALNQNGGVIAWGYNTNSEPKVEIIAESGIRAISAGRNLSLLLGV